MEDSNIILIAVTCGIGYLMTLAGLSKHSLELRRRRRTCPSFGRHSDARVCRACTAV
jgi:hypothetical protein